MLRELFNWVDNNEETPYKSNQKNCASSLDLPPLHRNKSSFVGLENRGATCYLNSLIQVLFMTPEFRSFIFALPLYKGGDIKELSNYLPKCQQRDILTAVQKLFVDLKELDIKAVSTEQLTKSFKWSTYDENIQHDVQELNRYIQ